MGQKRFPGMDRVRDARQIPESAKGEMLQPRARLDQPGGTSQAVQAYLFAEPHPHDVKREGESDDVALPVLVVAKAAFPFCDIKRHNNMWNRFFVRIHKW